MGISPLGGSNAAGQNLENRNPCDPPSLGLPRLFLPYLRSNLAQLGEGKQTTSLTFSKLLGNNMDASVNRRPRFSPPKCGLKSEFTAINDETIGFCGRSGLWCQFRQKYAKKQPKRWFLGLKDIWNISKILWNNTHPPLGGDYVQKWCPGGYIRKGVQYVWHVWYVALCADILNDVPDLALVTSVTCTRRPLKQYSSQLSTVPNRQRFCWVHGQISGVNAWER